MNMKPFDLHNKPKIETGFKVPDNYFENFEAKMLTQISAKETKVVSIFHRKQLWISSIAAVLLVIIALPVYFNLAKKSSLDENALEYYLTNEYSTYELVDKLSDEDISNLESAITINDEVVEEYLINTPNLDYYINE
ncbi:hypothetical protein ACFS5J_00460 [Flavobacterium chuncheonense]|uniref:Uncharacterized protein n=1 Tax=Flavobacterium chuncheonense TaxID=2026653 RepID=A0ABW5YHI6_9FLAO